MQEEAYGTRDRSYSAWHRRMSIRRFVGIEAAQTLAMIDLDSALYIEYDDGTKEPLALIETAIDVGQNAKSATVTTNLAKRCVPTLPAFVLLYKLSVSCNPADRDWPDIESFRVKRLWPKPEAAWMTLSPQQWADRLKEMRVKSAGLVDAMLNQAEAAQDVTTSNQSPSSATPEELSDPEYKPACLRPFADFPSVMPATKNATLWQ